MPRLFTGVEIPEEIGERVASLRGGLPGARWVEPENYHITLRFLGDVDGAAAEAFADALAHITAPAFRLWLDGVGSFGRGKPHAVWAGVAPAEPLAALHRAHDKAARTAGFPPDNRNFHAHVTLARLRHAKQRTVARYLEERGAFMTESFAVNRFVLFSSRPGRGGGTYLVERAYPLEPEGAEVTQSPSPAS